MSDFHLNDAYNLCIHLNSSKISLYSWALLKLPKENFGVHTAREVLQGSQSFMCTLITIWGKILSTLLKCLQSDGKLNHNTKFKVHEFIQKALKIPTFPGTIQGPVGQEIC